MPRSSPSSHRLRFGAFELDPSSGQLRKNGTVLKLPPQPFRVLLLLVERSGTVVTREEIQNHLWSNSTFVDFEHGINFSINQIRSALVDNPDKPRYIETLPRRGYRFLLPVERLAPQSEAALPAASPSQPLHSFQSDTASLRFDSIPTTPVRTSPLPIPSSIRSFSRHRLWMLLLMAAILLTFPLILFYLAFLPVPRVVHIQQLTESGRVDPWGRVISDGTRLYYLEREGDRWHVRQAAITGGESQPFPVPFPNTFLFALSPDSSQILVAPFVTRGGTLPLWSMPLVGGAPRRIGELLANDVAFSPDGRQIAFTDAQGAGIADLQGSQIRRIAELPGNNWNVTWSPGGQIVRFSHSSRAPFLPSIFEVNVRGTGLHAILPQGKEMSAACCGHWNSDGSYYFFNSWHNYDTDLWALPAPPLHLSWLHMRPIRLTSGPISYAWPLPSDRGHVVYAIGGTEQIDLLNVDPRIPSATPVLPGARATDLALSPDGQWVSYVTPAGLWRSRPDGRECLQLAANSPQLRILYPRWRSDSRFLLFLQESDPEVDQVSVVSADGGPVRTLIRGDHLRERADWSPDGKSIVFSIVDDTASKPANRGIHFFTVETGQTSKLPGSEGLFCPRWSPDGRYLAAISSDEGALKLYDVSSRRWLEIARGKSLSAPVWSSDSNFLYFQDILGPGQALSRYSLPTKTVEPVFNFEPLFKTGAARYGFLGINPDHSLLVRASGRGSNVYRLDLDLP